MRPVPRCSLLLILVSIGFLAFAQQPPPPTTQAPHRDPQALAILTQVLNAAGGSTALSAIQDVTGSGTITYYWAGKEVQGSVTLKARGRGQFRLDAELPGGRRSFILDNGSGKLKKEDGTTASIPNYQAASFGDSAFFPLGQLLTAFQDTSTSISYQGLVSRAGHQVHDIRIQGLSVPAGASGGIPTKLSTQDFLIDATSFQVVSTLGSAYSTDGSNTRAPAEIQFSNYGQVGGILVPFSITNSIAGQTTFTIQLNSVTFNSNLSDADFQL